MKKKDKKKRKEIKEKRTGQSVKPNSESLGAKSIKRRNGFGFEGGFSVCEGRRAVMI